ncbi:MAG TPA: preprotein translocase subunit SecG [Bacteroidetes bacterium]|nr:preprotein translocase subunit SecG [Bacteroidota bacterium]
MLYTVFGFMVIVASILLILIVVIQNSKGGGLSSTFGASNLTAMVGSRRAGQDIEKFTWYFAGGMMLLCFMATISQSSGTVQEAESLGTIMEAPSALPAPAAAPQPATPPVGGAPQ